MNTLVLASGGPDSFIAYHWVRYVEKKDVTLGVAALATRASLGEHYAITKTLSDVPQLEFLCPVEHLEEEDANVPARNLLLPVLAVMHGYRDIVISIQKDEMTIPDRQQGFMEATSLALSLSVGAPVHFRTPFADMDKTDMVGWYLSDSRIPDDEKTRREKLSNTLSCYKPTWAGPEDRFDHCGNCAACIRRYIAFKPLQVATNWRMQPTDSSLSQDYVLRAKGGHYSAERNRRILEALT